MIYKGDYDRLVHLGSKYGFRPRGRPIENTYFLVPHTTNTTMTSPLNPNTVQSRAYNKLCLANFSRLEFINNDTFYEYKYTAYTDDIDKIFEELRKDVRSEIVIKSYSTAKWYGIGALFPDSRYQILLRTQDKEFFVQTVLTYEEDK